MTYTIIKINKPRFRSKIAAFDFDATLIKPQSKAFVPRNVDDWMWLRESVPSVVKEIYDKGYGIYIFTNQSRHWKQDMIEKVATLLQVPVTIAIAFEKAEYKPNPSMFETAVGKNMNKVKKEASFMVGDAIGRPEDHSDSDLVFAKNIGIKCLSPEKVFPFDVHEKYVSKPKKQINTKTSKQKIIVMVGYPGSGKSTIANKIVGKKENYVIADGDTLKTLPKIHKFVKAELENKKSVIIDSTNPTKERRAEFINIAKEFGVPIICVHIITSYDESFYRNNNREKVVPKIAFNVYRKRFELPTIEEGFKKVLEIYPKPKGLSNFIL